MGTFNFLLNPLFFLLFFDIPTKESSLIKWRAKFQISRLLWFAFPVSPKRHSIGWVIYTLVETYFSLNLSWDWQKREDQALISIHIFKVFSLGVSTGIDKWQQRNGQIIHDVTSVKYKKKNDIFSLIDMFSKIK